jgi:phage/plasmid primase-like uncharacterized protein
MNDDRLGRALTTAAVLLVAAIAAVVSYIHIEHLAVTHGQTAVAAMLLPLSIDGTVVASSMVMLRAARAGVAAPWLARFGLALSVAATLAANLGYGAAHGLAGALMSGWPAAAFIICAEMAIGMVRRMRPQAGSGSAHMTARGSAPRVRTPKRPRTRAPGASVTGDDAEREFMSELASGALPSLRQIRSRMHVGQDRARQIRDHLEGMLART